MATKSTRKPKRKVKDLPSKGLSTKQTERIKGGKRIVVFLVPPAEIPSK